MVFFLNYFINNLVPSIRRSGKMAMVFFFYMDYKKSTKLNKKRKWAWEAMWLPIIRSNQSGSTHAPTTPTPMPSKLFPIFNFFDQVFPRPNRALHTFQFSFPFCLWSGVAAAEVKWPSSSFCSDSGVMELERMFLSDGARRWFCGGAIATSWLFSILTNATSWFLLLLFLSFCQICDLLYVHVPIQLSSCLCFYSV